MSNEVLSTGLKTELFVYLRHGILVEVDAFGTLLLNCSDESLSLRGRTLVGSRVLILPALKELEELLRPPLLKQTHEGTLHRLHLRARNFGDLAITIHEAARDLLELEVAGDIGVNENARKFSRGNDELGNEIDGIVAIAAEVLRGRLVGPELAVKLRQ